MDIMFRMLLGHLTGDYLLQNQFMALNKTSNTWKGWLAATIHCLLYTFAVCLFMWNFHLIWIIAVFFSHFFIDKFGLGEIYMKYIKGNGLRDYINEVNNTYSRTWINSSDGERMITGGFKAVVYTLTDNTMHLILMWGAYQLIY
jgi:hypothetical protein